MEFKDLGLAEPIVRVVAHEGYATPTPIQAKAIPHVIAGSDLFGCAQTGTGKTAAFALPIIHRLAGANPHRGPAGRKPRALVLCPTRELASQIGESFKTYGTGMHLSYTTLFGGVGQNPQVHALRNGVDIVIATPGRLLDLIEQGHVHLSCIQILVLDEADRMLDMGFIHDIRKIVARVPKERQTLLFSATMPSDIRSLASSIMRNPAHVHVDPVSSAAKSVTQTAYLVPRRDKGALLRSMLRGEASGRSLVFTRTKHGADKVVKDLMKAGIRAAAIHGNKSQNARTRALDAFKSNSPPVLVATDIASRGIDVDAIGHVFNFDIPHEPETYVHRIGRTARAGATGTAVSFCDPEERGALRAIERLTGARIEMRTAGSEVQESAAHEARAATAERGATATRAAPTARIAPGARTAPAARTGPVPHPTTALRRGISKRSRARR